MKVKILTWKQIKCKSTKRYDKSRIPIGDGYIFNHKMKYLCGTIVDLDAESQVYDETNNRYWTIPDWMIDKSYTETIYPRFIKHKDYSFVLKYTSPKDRVCVIADMIGDWEVGQTDPGNDIDTVLSLADWIELPYDSERDLFHTQAILCWDEDSTAQAICLYDAKQKEAIGFVGGNAVWDHYEAYPEEHLSDRMKQLRTTLS